jgi:hypothetical protein
LSKISGSRQVGYSLARKTGVGMTDSDKQTYIHPSLLCTDKVRRIHKVESGKLLNSGRLQPCSQILD